MTSQDLQVLVNIYNALYDGVTTTGSSTIVMGKCLESLNNFIIAKTQEYNDNLKKDKEE